MRVIGITEPSVHEPWIVYSSHLVEEIVRSLGKGYGLFFGVEKIFQAFHWSLIEVEHTQVIETAENIKMDLRLRKLQLTIKGVIPGNIEVLHNIPVLGIPVKMLGNKPSIPDIHLDNGNIFVNGLDIGVGG